MRTSIIGAGLSGLLAASHFPEATIYEKNFNENFEKHMALLRFRKPDIGDHLGISFKQVIVHKGIWHNGHYIQPSIEHCNMYAQKVSKMINDRSIWNIDTVTRWIAPDNLHEILIDRYFKRIVWGIDYNFEWQEEENVISTMPMPAILNKLNNDDDITNDMKMHSNSIIVERYEIDSCDAYQTVYYPSSKTNVYRASLSGNILIVEYMVNEIGEHIPKCLEKDMHEDVLPSFGIAERSTNILYRGTKNYGKLRPVDDRKRKELIHHLTLKYNIFSLGRFAIWKNIMLDDVFHDIQVIKKLINAGRYEIVKKNFNF